MIKTEVLDCDAEYSLLWKMMSVIGKKTVIQAKTSLSRLKKISKGKKFEDLSILMPFGGGKDSAWALSYLRLMQLIVLRDMGQTFHIDVLIFIHQGMQRGVYKNIRSTLTALAIFPDPTDRVAVYGLLRNNLKVEICYGNRMDEGIDLFRDEIILSGHISQGNGRETFCNACNFALMKVITQHVIHKGGKYDYVVTGDSIPELNAYWDMVQEASLRFRCDIIPDSDKNWGSVFSKLSELNTIYYDELFNRKTVVDSSYYFPDVKQADIELPKFFILFTDTAYEYYEHQTFMEEFLNFKLDVNAFNFTESDCGNPMLMAHLRGLLSDFEGRSYVTGIREYLKLATRLMKQKSFSHDMITEILARYDSVDRIMGMKTWAEAYAAEAYNLTPQQMETMVASPFTDNHVRLKAFLEWKHPEQLKNLSAIEAFLDWHCDLVEEHSIGFEDFLAEANLPEIEFLTVERFLLDITGLSTEFIRLLSMKHSLSFIEQNYLDNDNKFLHLRAKDPHQMVIGNRVGRANNIMTGR